MVLTQHRGFVRGFDGDKAVIALRSGGKLTVNRGNLRLGQRVVVVPNHAHSEVLEVMDLSVAEHAVRCGLDHIYAAASREPDAMPEDEWEVFVDEFMDRPEEDYHGEIECGKDDDVYGIAQ